ncbi:hypothetical protein HK102_005842 [Quaeritorhiza haematococci]|nr:hypothetical protein HK102_005842 [Quaeritorhiza haematococci]
MVSAIKSSMDIEMPAHRWPFIFLDLSVPTESIDVNVEPDKTTVFFHFPDMILDSVTDFVQSLYHSDPQYHALQNDVGGKAEDPNNHDIEGDHASNNAATASSTRKRTFSIHARSTDTSSIFKGGSIKAITELEMSSRDDATTDIRESGPHCEAQDGDLTTEASNEVSSDNDIEMNHAPQLDLPAPTNDDQMPSVDNNIVNINEQLHPSPTNANPHRSFLQTLVMNDVHIDEEAWSAGRIVPDNIECDNFSIESGPVVTNNPTKSFIGAEDDSLRRRQGGDRDDGRDKRQDGWRQQKENRTGNIQGSLIFNINAKGFKSSHVVHPPKAAAT